MRVAVRADLTRFHPLTNMQCVMRVRPAVSADICSETTLADVPMSLPPTDMKLVGAPF